MKIILVVVLLTSSFYSVSAPYIELGSLSGNISLFGGVSSHNAYPDGVLDSSTTELGAFVNLGNPNITFRGQVSFKPHLDTYTVDFLKAQKFYNYNNTSWTLEGGILTNTKGLLQGTMYNPFVRDSLLPSTGLWLESRGIASATVGIGISYLKYNEVLGGVTSVYVNIGKSYVPSDTVEETFLMLNSSFLGSACGDCKSDLGRQGIITLKLDRLDYEILYSVQAIEHSLNESSSDKRTFIHNIGFKTRLGAWDLFADVSYYEWDKFQTSDLDKVTHQYTEPEDYSKSGGYSYNLLVRRTWNKFGMFAHIDRVVYDRKDEQGKDRAEITPGVPADITYYEGIGIGVNYKLDNIKFTVEYMRNRGLISNRNFFDHLPEISNSLDDSFWDYVGFQISFTL